jgi:hypothetical protein
MSYLKIYPKSIIALLNAEGNFEGELTLHIEQYGLQEKDQKCPVKITQDKGQWQIYVHPMTGLQIPQFSQFMDSLNHYLFSVLKLTPSPDTTGIPLIEVFFDDVYFDMTGDTPFHRRL